VTKKEEGEEGRLSHELSFNSPALFPLRVFELRRQLVFSLTHIVSQKSSIRRFQLSRTPLLSSAR